MFPDAKPSRGIMLNDKDVVNCDSQQAKAARAAYVVPLLIEQIGEALIEIDAFGPAYWKGDWDALVKKRFAHRKATALERGAATYEGPMPLTLSNTSGTPLVYAAESAMLGLRGSMLQPRVAMQHWVVFYTVSGDYAIEIRLTGPTASLVAATTGIVERSIICPTCSLPKTATDSARKVAGRPGLRQPALK